MVQCLPVSNSPPKLLIMKIDLGVQEQRASAFLGVTSFRDGGREGGREGKEG